MVPALLRAILTTIIALALPTEAGWAQASEAEPIRGAAQAKASTPARISARVFDAELVIEVKPLDDAVQTRDGLADSLDEARELEGLLRAGHVLDSTPLQGRGVRALNAHSGAGPTEVDPRVLLALARALEICRWSRGAYGPLGGILNGLWGLRQPVGGLPSDSVLSQQVALTSCDRLELDSEKSTATLLAGSRVDLWGFERGFTVDRVIEILQERGFADGWVQIGFTLRAFGGGPDGKGWPMAIDPTEDRETPTERILLFDRALAMASLRERTIEIAGERYAPWIDQRSGHPAEGKSAVMVVAETAFDAEALAGALFVLNNREGEFYLGTLRPQPAVRWFLGTDQGPPLVMESGWSWLPRWTP